MQTSIPLSKAELIQQCFNLLKQIAEADQNPEMPTGGVDLSRSNTAISGNFLFPVTYSPSTNGESVTLQNFLL